MRVCVAYMMHGAGEGTKDLNVTLTNFGVNGIKTLGLANGTVNVTSSDYVDGKFNKYARFRPIERWREIKSARAREREREEGRE